VLSNYVLHVNSYIISRELFSCGQRLLEWRENLFLLSLHAAVGDPYTGHTAARTTKTLVQSNRMVQL
jgi:hypothetical protein